MNMSLSGPVVFIASLRRLRRRVIFRSQSKRMGIPTTKRATADVIAGAILALVVLSSNRRRELAPEIFASEKMRYTKMEYLIVIGVVAMMALYVVIIARCLDEPEWR